MGEKITQFGFMVYSVVSTLGWDIKTILEYNFVLFTENMKINVILRYAEELQLVIHQQNMSWIFKLTYVKEIEEKYFWLIFVWNSRAIFYLSYLISLIIIIGKLF